MIYLITGRPRNGKSLYTLDYISKKAETEGRPVYYNRIKDVKYPNWFELQDATKWTECPHNSIIVFDECQHDFRNRSATSTPPKHVLPLNEHGHYGYDLFFISQHPKFVDPDVKGLTQEHHHVVRHFGKEKATIHRWDVVKDNPDSKVNKADSIKKTFVFPKSVYSMYHSSSHHNVVENVPLKYKLLYIIPLIILALVGKVVYSWYIDDETIVDAVANEVKGVQQGITPQLPQTTQDHPRTTEQKALTTAEMYQPAIEGLLHTAPVYFQVNTPKVAPFPAACVSMGSNCKCYTQQGTLYPSKKEFCLNIVKHGIFNEMLDPMQQQQPQQAQQVAELAP